MPRPPRFPALAAAGLALLTALTACGPGSHAPSRTSAPSRLGGATGSATTSVRLVVRRAGYRLPAPVQRAVAVAAGNGGAYILGGLDAAGTSANGVFLLNTSSGRLQTVGSLPDAFHDGAGGTIGGRIFVFGGGSATGTDLVQAVDTASGNASVVGRLPGALSDLSAVTLDAQAGGGVYLVGGWDGTTPQRTIWRTTDGRRFTAAGRLPTGLRYAAATAVGSTIVVAGGETASGPVATTFAFDTTTGAVRRLPDLPAPVAHAAAFTLDGVAYVVGGQDASGHAVSSVTAVDALGGAVAAQPPLAAPVSDAAVATTPGGVALIGGWRDGHTLDQVLLARARPVRAVGASPAAASPSASASSAGPDPSLVRPFAGLLLVADRGNDRLLVLNPKGHIVWRYPSPDLPAPPVPFSFPDDAFWVHGGNAILVNEEDNDVLTEIAYPSGRTLWTYGHPGSPGSSPGYTHQPDDLYPYPGGGMVVADAMNCRLLFFGPAGRPTGQIGKTGNCRAGLPTTVGYPNAATPLPNGHILITELHGGVVSEVTPTGHPVWQVRIPALSVPSDPQPLPDGSFLAVDYASPGAVVRFSSSGKVLWEYRPTSGPGVLDHPSLAAPLPNGLIAVNDDYQHRVVLIDPKTDRIVWQYGVTNVPGTSHGHLRYPDGLDLLLPGNRIPLHVDFASPVVHDGRP